MESIDVYPMLTAGLLVLLFSTPTLAFVERLHPNTPFNGASISCHTMGAAFRAYIRGAYTAGNIGSKIEQETLCGPDKVCQPGEGWTQNDSEDNAAAIALINGLPVADRSDYVSWVEDACLLWEKGFTDFDTPAEFRTRIGLPANP
jgi:hypothetical protein